MQIPKYIKVIKKYYGTRDNLVVGDYIDTQDLEQLTNFSKFNSWEDLAKNNPLKEHFLEVTQEEYNEAKGIEPVVNNTFPIY